MVEIDPMKGQLAKGDAKIWRYIDFAKFISLLENILYSFSQ